MRKTYLLSIPWNATVFGYRRGEIPQTGRLEFPADEWMRKEILRRVCRIRNWEPTGYLGGNER